MFETNFQILFRYFKAMLFGLFENVDGCMLDTPKAAHFGESDTAWQQIRRVQATQFAGQHHSQTVLNHLQAHIFINKTTDNVLIF